MFDLHIIPVETFVEILKYLNGTTLGKCRQVSKIWKDIIDGNDQLWQAVCRREFKCSSKVARRKASVIFKWYHIYKNLRMWSKITEYECSVRSFYEFSLNDNNHALEISDSVLPLKDAQGVVLYDMSSLKYIPAAIPERDCFKFANNNFATVLLVKSKLIIARTYCDGNHETHFQANDFILKSENLLYHHNRHVYKCDLNVNELNPKLIMTCVHDIKEMQYEDSVLVIFTQCGRVVISKNSEVHIEAIKIPFEWLKQVKYINAIDERNFVCFSRNLFKIETDKYQHLYLDFPPMTALFFYGDDIVLIGTGAGEILLYRLSRQQPGAKPILEKIANLPEGKFAVHIDVTERRAGPVIVIGTFYELLLIEVNFFPHEEPLKTTFGPEKVAMFKRLMKIRDKFMNSYSEPSGRISSLE